MREVGTANPRWIVLGVGAALGWTLAKIAVPLLVLKAVERGIDPYDGASLLRWAILVVAVTLVIGALTFARRFAAFRISLYAEAELRRRLFDHLQRLHFGYHDRAADRRAHGAASAPTPNRCRCSWSSSRSRARTS